jgi:hypothetical protein
MPMCSQGEQVQAAWAVAGPPTALADDRIVLLLTPRAAGNIDPRATARWSAPTGVGCTVTLRYARR